MSAPDTHTTVDPDAAKRAADEAQKKLDDEKKAAENLAAFTKKVVDTMAEIKNITVQDTKVILSLDQNVRDSQLMKLFKKNMYQAIYNTLYNMSKDDPAKLTELRTIMDIDNLVYKTPYATEHDDVASETITKIANQFAQKNHLQAWKLMKKQVVAAYHLISRVQQKPDGTWISGSLSDRVNTIFEIVQNDKTAKDELNVMHSVMKHMNMVLVKTDPMSWGMCSLL